MSTNVKGSCVDVVDFKCSAFCNIRVFNEGQRFDTSTGMIVSSNRFGITIVASPNQLCLISMKHLRQLVGDFGIEKNTLTNFLRREIELDYFPNFLDLSCDESFIAVAGTSNSKPSITVYNIESLISQGYINPLVFIELEATQGSHVIDLSWNPGVQNSLACCLSDGSLYVIEIKDGGIYTTVSLPPQSNTLCLSWSPKGKQIIIGSANGSLTQYKPELKAVKQYSPPSDISNVQPIKVKWISNFQFAVVYDFVKNTNDQPNLYILNTPKNAPVEFINFEQYVVMNSEQYRLNQYYTIFQQNWNLLFVASSNCTEIGVMGINNTNQWQCWVLETRPELPYRLDKQMYPLGMSLDLSSQMRIRQMSKSNEEIFIDPMPVLCVLSSDGVLFMYHIENQLADYQNICKSPSEISDSVITQLFTCSSKYNDVEKQIVTEIVEQHVEEINVVDDKSRGDNNESVLASYLETSTTSQSEQQPLTMDNSKISVVKPSVPASSPVQNVPSQPNPPPITNTSTDEVVKQLMLNEVMEDVYVFQTQLEDALNLSLKTSKLKIGNENDKEILVKKWTSLDLFFKELNETNRSQWAESKSLQKAVLDSIAWVEDSKSRLFFLKNPRYKCLLRNDDDEPFSKALFENIERTLYYVETQLTHVDDQLKARYDSYNPNNKDSFRELKIPCLETIYKSLVVNTNIVNKLKEKIDCLGIDIEEAKYKTFKKLSLATDVFQNTSKLNESRDVGLTKLSEQLLKITLDKDGVSAINSYNIAKKYSVLSANQRALSDSKVNKLQEWLKDFKTRRTKITRSKYANIDLSRPVCSTPLKPTSKPKVLENNIDFTPIITQENFSSTSTPSLLNRNYNINQPKIEKPSVSKSDITQFNKPLFIPTTQPIIATKSTPITVVPTSTAFSLGSKPLPISTIITPSKNSVENSSTPKPLLLNNFSNKFEYKALMKNTPNPDATTTSFFGSIKTSTDIPEKNPVDFSFKSSATVPLNFSSLNTVSTNFSESKDKIPFSFASRSTVKTESTVPKANIATNFNFADSIKNKMENSKETPLSNFNFDTSKSLSKPLESPSTLSGCTIDEKSKDKLENATFNFTSKPDASSFSSFSFTTPKDDTSKPPAIEAKSILTPATSTSVSASFSFSLPPKSTIATVASEPVSSSTVSSSFEVVKTKPVFSTMPATTTNSSVTDTTPRDSDSPTPIISEPVTPENEKVPIIPVTSDNAPSFEPPLMSTSIFGTSITATSTTSIFGNSTTVTQTSIFSSSASTTSGSSIFSTPTNTTSAPSLFTALISSTTATSIFGSTTSTTSASSIFGSPANATTSSSIFGTPTNATTASSIFGTPSTTTTSSIFGNPIKTTSSIFGAPTTTTVSSIFGSATTTSTTGGFGSPAQSTVFGSPVTTSSSMFGNPAVSASSSSIFGAASTTKSSIFGTPTATSTTSSIFGSPSTAPASSGLFGSVAAAANQPTTFGQPLGFSSPGSAFGNMSLFGQQACSPSQPTNSFTPPANPFAVNKTPSTTPSLFSNQKTVFGQPAASSTNTGFGVANTGFGTTPTGGFGSPAMGGQSSGLGFGSPPMFGSMGTAYDMSKSSGFGQAPVFGGSPSFGSPAPSQYTFGQNNTTPEAGSFGFGSSTQQQSTAFASLAAQSNSPSFGNIAQNQTAGFASPATAGGFGQPQQTSPFKPQGATFGGTSFSSWR